MMLPPNLDFKEMTQKVTVNVFNNKVETFETMPVEVRLQSHNGQIDVNIVAFTTNYNRVTGNNTLGNRVSCRYKIFENRTNPFR